MNHPKFTCNHINQKQLADRWDLSERTLERWRGVGWGPISAAYTAEAGTGHQGGAPLPPQRSGKSI